MLFSYPIAISNKKCQYCIIYLVVTAAKASSKFVFWWKILWPMASGRKPRPASSNCGEEMPRSKSTLKNHQSGKELTGFLILGFLHQRVAHRAVSAPPDTSSTAKTVEAQPFIQWIIRLRTLFFSDFGIWLVHWVHCAEFVRWSRP